MLKRRRENGSLEKSQLDRERQTNAWGWLATGGLALAAAVTAQVPALVALAWSRDYGLSLARLQHVTSDGVAVTTLLCVSTPVQVGLLFWFARLRSSSAIEYLALTLPRRRDIIVLLLSAALLLAISDGVSWLLGKNVVTSFQDDIYRSAASAGSLVWLWLAVVIVAPIGEETLFRGFLFRGSNPPKGQANQQNLTNYQRIVLHVDDRP
jgi:membrane protease YdiL (CAAX protease family)